LWVSVFTVPQKTKTHNECGFLLSVIVLTTAFVFGQPEQDLPFVVRVTEDRA
jgi:hypothetical protein